jgi:hypothetical protein
MLYLLREEFIPELIAEIVDETAWELAELEVLDDCFEHAIMSHMMDVIIDSVEFEKNRLDI